MSECILAEYLMIFLARYISVESIGRQMNFSSRIDIAILTVRRFVVGAQSLEKLRGFLRYFAHQYLTVLLQVTLGLNNSDELMFERSV